MLFLRIVLLILFHGFQGANSLWTVSKVTVQNGTSVTIPCHYSKMFRNSVKYWCKGRSFAICREITRTTSTSRTEGVFIKDYPSELVFTITMTNPQVKDTNRYWCAIKVSGFTRPDVRASMELQVTTDPPDLSVMENMVSVEEGGNVSIPCLYANELKYKVKKWCESGNLHKCRTAQSAPVPQEPSVAIADDGIGVFTVTVGELERKDTGWYWCSAGDVQAPVHINVTEKSERLYNVTATPPGQISTSSWAPVEKTTLGPAISTPTSKITSLSSSQPTKPSLGTSVGTSANPQTSGATSNTYLPSVVPTTDFYNTSSTVPSDNKNDSANHHRHLIWQSVVIGIGIAMTLVIIVGAFVSLRHRKRDNIRIALDDMTQDLNVEQDLEVDVMDDWSQSCLLYNDEAPQSEGTL